MRNCVIIALLLFVVGVVGAFVAVRSVELDPRKTMRPDVGEVIDALQERRKALTDQLLVLQEFDRVSNEWFEESKAGVIKKCEQLKLEFGPSDLTDVVCAVADLN